MSDLMRATRFAFVMGWVTGAFSTLAFVGVLVVLGPA